MRRENRRNALVLATLGVSCALNTARGQNIVWTGSANDFSWANPNNWSPTHIPGASDVAEFNSGGSGNANISLSGANQTVGAILFDGSALSYDLGTTSGDSFTINNQNISSTVGAIALTTAGNPQEIDANISYANTSPLITQGSASSGLTFGSAPGLASMGLTTPSSTSGLTIKFTASGTITINDSITSVGGSSTIGSPGNAGVATGGLQFASSASTGGTVVINGQSTYSGITNLNNGAGSVTLLIGSSTDTADSATFTKGPFGTSTLVPDSGTQTPMEAFNADQTVANPINAISGFTIANAATPHNLSFTGPITYSSTPATSRTFTFNNFGQTVTLGSASSPSTITLASGMISGTAQNLAFNPGNNAGTSAAVLVINDVIQDSGTPALPDTISYNSNGNNTPMGLVQINGANTYAGKTTINGQTSGTPVVGLTVQVGVNSVGSGASVTSGPFGKGTLTWNGNSSSPGTLEPFGADRTIGNNITLTSGFFVQEPTAAQDPTVTIAPHNLTLTGNITLGTTGRTMTNLLPAPGVWTLGSASSPAALILDQQLTFQAQVTAGPGGGVTLINDVVQDASPSSTGSLTVQNNAIVKLTNTNTYTGGTTVKAGGQLFTATNLSNGTLAVTTGGIATVNAQSTPGATAGVTVVPKITVDSSSKLDITNNGVVIDYTPGNSPLSSSIQPSIVSGAAGGAFTGFGITSSTAATVAANMSNPHKTAVGYAEANAIGIVGSGTFLGKTVDDSSVLIRYTLEGDANLDGIVNTLDFNALASNYGTGNTWVQGDYNYNGGVDSSDFDLLAANFGANVTATGAQPLAALGSVVPEPTTISLLAMSLLAARRKRTR